MKMKRFISLIILLMPIYAFAGTEYVTLGSGSDSTTIRIDTNGPHTTVTASSEDEAMKARIIEPIVDFAKEHPVAAGICAAVAGALYILSGAGN